LGRILSKSRYKSCPMEL